MNTFTHGALALVRVPVLVLLGVLALGAASLWAVAPAVAQGSVKPQQFVYVLRVAPALHDPSQWSAEHNDAVGRHFRRLAQATEARQVILAGRTTEPLDRTFGLVIFEAENAEAARRFMETDPAVVAGVMTATLHPYSVALLRKQP